MPPPEYITLNADNGTCCYAARTLWIAYGPPAWPRNHRPPVRALPMTNLQRPYDANPGRIRPALHPERVFYEGFCSRRLKTREHSIHFVNSPRTVLMLRQERVALTDTTP